MTHTDRNRARAGAFVECAGGVRSARWSNSLWAALGGDHAKMLFLGICIGSRLSALSGTELIFGIWAMRWCVMQCRRFSGSQRADETASRRMSRFLHRAWLEVLPQGVGGGAGIRTGKFGCGTFSVIETAPFYELAHRLLLAEPDLLLCDDERCMFCRSARASR